MATASYTDSCGANARRTRPAKCSFRKTAFTLAAAALPNACACWALLKRGIAASAMLSLERSLATTVPVPGGKSSSVTVPPVPTQVRRSWLLRLRHQLKKGRPVLTGNHSQAEFLRRP